jgi:predicted secreted protein
MKDTLQSLYEDKKSQLNGWCNCASVKTGKDLEDTDKIIVELAKEVNLLERYLILDEVSRGLNTNTLKTLVNTYFKEDLNLDENGYWVDGE